MQIKLWSILTNSYSHAFCTSQTKTMIKSIHQSCHSVFKHNTNTCISMVRVRRLRIKRFDKFILYVLETIFCRFLQSTFSVAHMIGHSSQNIQCRNIHAVSTCAYPKIAPTNYYSSLLKPSHYSRELALFALSGSLDMSVCFQWYHFFPSFVATAMNNTTGIMINTINRYSSFV